MKDKQFSWQNAVLAVCCLALNLLLIKAAAFFSLPLYLDSVGTVLAAALGGALPGVTVGFLTNLLGSLLSLSIDPLSLYFGVLNILIALAVAWFSTRGWLRRLPMCLALTALLAFIGGGLGAMITWLLYGFDFGGGITAPYAIYMVGQGVPKPLAELLASLAVDLADKAATMTILCLLLRFLPNGLVKRLPLGDRYDYSKPYAFIAPLPHKLFRKRSIRTKMVAIILGVTVLFSASSLIVGAVSFRQALIAEYEEKCTNTTGAILSVLDGDRMEEYLRTGGASEDYRTVKRELSDIQRNADKIKYVYVYSIREDGCHVVFDLDTDDLPGEQAGAVLPFDQDFLPYIPMLLQGEEIPPVITDGAYGWLLTDYRPVLDSAGKCVAYACADIDMEEINGQTYAFLISISSLLLGVFILATSFVLHYCDRVLLEPIGTLVDHTRAFECHQIENSAAIQALPEVNTGDELETLYRSICAKDERIESYIHEIKHKNDELALMQRNIIYSLANMTESRDANTGNHINRTASYVRLIAANLQAMHLPGYPITDDLIRQMYESAPLHDVGKIKISDVILNTPGRLTAEEFAVMKTHTVVGTEILRRSLEGVSDKGSLQVAMEMVGCHHERWDGGGYPHGLKGEAIPLSARIMAVADVFDALVSRRSYKDAMPAEEALRIVREESGKHFDPVVVEAFMANVEQIREIAKL